MSASVVFGDVAHANDVSVVVNKPVGSEVGDVLLVGAILQGNKNLIGIPIDMVAIPGITNPLQTGTASSNVRTWLFTHEITAESPVSWTFTQSASGRLSIIFIAVRGAKLTSLINIAAGDAGDLTAPSITTTAEGVLLYFGAHWQTGTSTNFSPPPGMSEHVDGGAHASGTWASEIHSSPGTTGTRTAVPSVETGSRVAALVLVTSEFPAVNVRLWGGGAWTAATTKKLWDGISW